MSSPTLATHPRQSVTGFPRSKISEASEYGAGRDGLIPLWFGESDQATPGFICDAADAALRAGHTFYGPKHGVQELRETLAAYLNRLYGGGISVDRIIALPGGMAAIMFPLQALVEPGRNVVMVTPVWPNAAGCVSAMGGELREVALDALPDGRWSLDLDKLFAAMDDKTVCLFINSPNNPTGWMATRVEQRAILAECRRRGIWILSDEVYDRITYDRPTAPSFLELADPEDRLIVANTFSKTWCMTGWRLGWAVLPSEMMLPVEKLNEINTTGAAPFIQYAGVAAVRDGEDFVAAQRAQYARNRDLVSERLGAIPGIKAPKPDGGFYCFLRAERAPDSVALARRIIDEANVGLAPGLAFGPAGEGYMRLCFAAATPTIETALDRLAPVLARL